MQLIQILVILSTLVALGAGVPQMIKLIKTKNSDEFSLGTWAMWICTQSVSAVYVFTTSDYLLLAINTAWVLFYIAMAGLIIKYSPQRNTQVALAQPQEASLSKL